MTSVVARRIENCPYVILIVYTTAGDAAARGYEPWLVDTDNPFFNAIPGVLCYQNWKVEGDAALPYTYFDLQGVRTDADVERVWLNSTLDEFRKNWIQQWGYGRAQPQPIHLHAYGMRPVFISHRPAQPTALIRTGKGAPPTDADLVWRVDEVLRKHFAAASSDDRWHWPARENNPLQRDWLALTYGAAPAQSQHTGDADSFAARLIATPPEGTPG